MKFDSRTNRFKAGVCALVVLVCLSQWTSAGEKVELNTVDGETYKGELIGVYLGAVFIANKRGGTSYFPVQALDSLSKRPVRKWLREYKERTQGDPDTVAESDSDLSRFLSDKLQVWKDGELVDYDFASKAEPEFYAFYYSAHWCGPCRRFTPELRAFYEAMKKLGHDNFEIVFVSSDQSGSMMKQYMEEDEMPWPALRYNKRSHSRVAKYKGNGIPCLVVTDRHGNMLAHSYNGKKYLGPDVPKKMLGQLLKYTSELAKEATKEES